MPIDKGRNGTFLAGADCAYPTRSEMRLWAVVNIAVFARIAPNERFFCGKMGALTNWQLFFSCGSATSVSRCDSGVLLVVAWGGWGE
jgi:hypothetical protein